MRLAPPAPWLIVSSVLACSVAEATPRRGVALGLFAEDPGWSYRGLIDEIAATGASHVALVINWYQRDGAATEIFEHPRYTAPADAVANAVADARRAGLVVTLFPIVRVLVPRDHEWRGTLAPGDRAAWWRSYGARLLALAELGARAGASSLSVGSELSTLDGARDRDAWAALVAAVRRRFAGELIYSANFDHYRDVAVYDLVDVAGVSAYFPVAAAGEPAALETASYHWAGVRLELQAFAAALGRPIVFTEVGYRSVRGALARPWDESAEAEVSLVEQRLGYAAFARVFGAAPAHAFGGAYFWNWYGYGGPTSHGYTPRGKPALEVLRGLFQSPPPLGGWRRTSATAKEHLSPR